MKDYDASVGFFHRKIHPYALGRDHDAPPIEILALRVGRLPA
jgi:hypothetical protein